jgi:hypothetical protein
MNKSEKLMREKLEGNNESYMKVKNCGPVELIEDILDYEMRTVTVQNGEIVDTNGVREERIDLGETTIRELFENDELKLKIQREVSSQTLSGASEIAETIMRILKLEQEKDDIQTVTQDQLIDIVCKLEAVSEQKVRDEINDILMRGRAYEIEEGKLKII